MTEEHDKPRFEFTKRMTYLLVSFVVLVGMILLLLGILFKEYRFVSVLFTTLGVASIVSIATGLLQRHFSYATQYEEMRKETGLKITSLLESRYEVLNVCSEVGVRQVYATWPSFCETVLPGRLETLQTSFFAIGIGLSDLSQAFLSGALRTVFDKHLRGKSITFCTVQPDRSGVDYREKELGARNSTNASLKASLSFLQELRGYDQGIRIKTLEEIVPRATIVCLDDEVIFYAPYFSKLRNPSSLVIETHKGDVIFQRISDDIEHLMKRAKDWDELPKAGDHQ
jgi:hypothetical protein